MCEKLRKGVVLDDDPNPSMPMRPTQWARARPCHLRLTLLQGKYHQVKRMVAAVSNRVEGLHRSQIGAPTCPRTSAPGQWRWIEDPAIVLP